MKLTKHQRAVIDTMKSNWSNVIRYSTIQKGYVVTELQPSDAWGKVIMKVHESTFNKLLGEGLIYTLDDGQYRLTERGRKV